MSNAATALMLDRIVITLVKNWKEIAPRGEQTRMIHRILRLSEVKAITGLSRSTIYSRVAESTFPKQIVLGRRTVGWLENEIQDWLQRQIQTTRSSQPNPKEKTAEQLAEKKSCGETDNNIAINGRGAQSFTA